MAGANAGSTFRGTPEQPVNVTGESGANSGSAFRGEPTAPVPITRPKAKTKARKR